MMLDIDDVREPSSRFVLIKILAITLNGKYYIYLLTTPTVKRKREPSAYNDFPQKADYIFEGSMASLFHV